MTHFVMGAMFLGLGAAGLFFLRFWARARDPLFLFFAAAFWIMALNRLAFAVLLASREANLYLYGLRLAAFVLIIIAIVNKNSTAPPSARR
jgi:hypothetical protein